MEYYLLLLPLAMILLLSKLLGIGARHIGVPQVVGMLLAGVLLGLIKYIPGQTIFTENTMKGIDVLAEIGVILIMFSAGLETDVKQIKATGVASLIITSLGVIVPMVLGFVVAGLFFGFDSAHLHSNIFYGVILTATSVSVTVATLKELGKLNSKAGTAIISAAILDDIIGVIILSVVLGLSTNMGTNVWMVLLKTVLFFVFTFGVGFVVRYIFKWLENHYEHHRRLPIFGICLAFFYAYAAEKWFGIADITGAYVAGMVLCGDKTSEYIERRTDITSYMIFTPIFFAKIGLNVDFAGLDLKTVGFGLSFVLAGILGKIIGCSVGAKISRFDWKDSFRCGIGMMCRAEVCLICANKGINAGLIDASIQPFLLILIIFTSFVTPLLLKWSYKKEQIELVS